MSCRGRQRSAEIGYLGYVTMISPAAGIPLPPCGQRVEGRATTKMEHLSRAKLDPRHCRLRARRSPSTRLRASEGLIGRAAKPRCRPELGQLLALPFIACAAEHRPGRRGSGRGAVPRRSGHGGERDGLGHPRRFWRSAVRRPERGPTQNAALAAGPARAQPIVTSRRRTPARSGAPAGASRTSVSIWSPLSPAQADRVGATRRSTASLEHAQLGDGASHGQGRKNLRRTGGTLSRRLDGVASYGDARGYTFVVTIRPERNLAVGGRAPVDDRRGIGARRGRDARRGRTGSDRGTAGSADVARA